MMISWMAEKALNKDDSSVKITNDHYFFEKQFNLIPFQENFGHWGWCLIELF